MRVSLLGVPSASVHGEKVLMVQQTVAARGRRSRAARQAGSVWRNGHACLADLPLAENLFRKAAGRRRGKLHGEGH